MKLFCRVLCLALIGAAVMHGRVSAEQSIAASPLSKAPIAFDLPAQALGSAIESYSVASGWQVIYDASLANGRRSAPVKGEFAPSVALRVLLTGTGLIPEYMAADGAMLVPDPVATAQAAALKPAAHVRDYYGRIQTGLKRAFCADDQIRSGAYRVAIGFWIGSSGAVTRTLALGSTGGAEIDAAFDRAVRKLSVGYPPPASFEQPVVILVTPDLLDQCNAAGLWPIRAAR